ncbi:MAG: PIN domain-containing protein [Acidobacteria bacterium]|nr:PIN domain-containing protein [Acidobacteriota bacterium]
MTDLVFVDTNVFVYWLDSSEPAKQARAAAWLRELWSDRSGRLSYQVLLEFYVTVTRKLARPLEAQEARSVCRSLLAWDPTITEERTLAAAWALQDRYQLSWWDALIVASAQLLECRYLLTEDLQHGQDLGGVEVVNPFVTPAGRERAPG